MLASLPPLTSSTRAAFLKRVTLWHPKELSEVEVGLDRAIAWTLQQNSALLPLPANDQDTVAFGLDESLVIWRAYPGKTVPDKLALLPGLRDTLSEVQRSRLVSVLESLVPGTAIAPGAHLQVGLVHLADEVRFNAFARFLEMVLEAGTEYRSSRPHR